MPGGCSRKNCAAAAALPVCSSSWPGLETSGQMWRAFQKLRTRGERQNENPLDGVGAEAAKRPPARLSRHRQQRRRTGWSVRPSRPPATRLAGCERGQQERRAGMGAPCARQEPRAKSGGGQGRQRPEEAAAAGTSAAEAPMAGEPPSSCPATFHPFLFLNSRRAALTSRLLARAARWLALNSA